MVMVDSIQKAISPLLFISRLYGLLAFEYPPGRVRPYLSYCYVFILWTAYTILFYYVFSVISTLIITHSPISILIFVFNMITYVVSTIMGFFYGKKFHDCLERLSAIDDTLDLLGVTKDYSKMYKRTWRYILIWIVLTFILNAIEARWSYRVYQNIALIFVPYLVNHALHANMIVDLNVIIILRHIEDTYDRLNECIKKLMIDERSGKKWFERKSIIRRQDPNIDEKNRRIMWIAMHLHLEICKASHEVNTVFQTQMTFQMGSYFIFVIGHLIYIYSLHLLLHENFTNKILNIISMVFWLIVYVVKVISINDLSDRVCYKAKRTKAIIDELLISSYDVEIRTHVTQFILQIIQNPLQFSGMGLFRFGHVFVKKFFASISIVVTIVIQMKALPKETMTIEPYTDIVTTTPQ